MIKTVELSKVYKKQVALDSVSIDIKKSTVTAIVGPNGSGKTTLLKSILGLVIPNDGTVYFDGITIKNNTEYRKRIGYLPQNHGFPPNLMVKESIRLLKDLRSDVQDYDLELYTKFGLEEHQNKQIKQLSGGTLQKLSAAIAFMFRPELLILDEPTSSLDPVASGILKEKIRSAHNSGTTVILTSHIMPEVDELAEQLIFLLEGTVKYSGSVENLKIINDTPDLERAVAKIMTREFVPCTT